MVHYVLTINNRSTNFSSQKSFITNSSKHPFAFLLLLYRGWNCAQTDLGLQTHRALQEVTKVERRTFPFFQEIFIEFIFVIFICDKHFVLFNCVEMCPNTPIHTVVKKQRVEILTIGQIRTFPKRFGTSTGKLSLEETFPKANDIIICIYIYIYKCVASLKVRSKASKCSVAWVNSCLYIKLCFYTTKL